MSAGGVGRGAGRPRKIDVAILAEMVRQGATFRDVQDRFNVTRKAVREACDRNDLPHPRLTSLGRGPRCIERPPQDPPPAAVHPPRLAALIATGGRYADLAAWARDWGVTEVKARQEWHKLGLPVGKGVGT